MFEKCEEQIWRFGTALQYSPPFSSIVDLLSTRRSSSAAGSDAAASKSSFGTSHVCEKINPLDPFNGDPAQHHWYGCGGGVGPIWGESSPNRVSSLLLCRQIFDDKGALIGQHWGWNIFNTWNFRGTQFVEFEKIHILLKSLVSSNTRSGDLTIPRDVKTCVVLQSTQATVGQTSVQSLTQVWPPSCPISSNLCQRRWCSI